MTRDSADAAARPEALEFAFLDFQGFVPWVFRLVIVFVIALPLAIVQALGALSFGSGVGGVCALTAAALAIAWRAHSVRVWFRHPPAGPPELLVAGRSIPLADPRALQVGLYRDVAKRWASRGRPLVRDYVHFVVPFDGGVLVLEELLIGAVQYPNVPWLEAPGKKRPRALRSLHPWPGPLARILKELDLLPG